MAVQLFPLRFGVSTPTTPKFSGLNKLEAIGGGCLLANWTALTTTATSIKVYIRSGSSDIFSSTYLLADVPATLSEFVIKTEKDGSTFLQTDNTYHVGVRANNDGSVDVNETTLSKSPGGSDSYVKVVSGKVAVQL